MYFPGHQMNEKDRLLKRKEAAEQKLMIAARTSDNPETYSYQIIIEKL